MPERRYAVDGEDARRHAEPPILGQTEEPPMKPIHHSSWRRRVLAPALLCTLPSLVQPGANEGGCLLFHATPALVYTGGVGD